MWDPVWKSIYTWANRRSGGRLPPMDRATQSGMMAYRRISKQDQ